MGIRLESVQISAEVCKRILASLDIEDCYDAIDSAEKEHCLNLDSMWMTPLELINNGAHLDEPLLVGEQIQDEESGVFAYVADVETVKRVALMYEDLTPVILAERSGQTDLDSSELEGSEDAVAGMGFRDESAELAWLTIQHVRAASESGRAIISTMSM